MRKLLTFLIALTAIVGGTVASQGQGVLLLVKPGGGGSPTWGNFTAAGNSSCGFPTTCNISSVTVASGFVVATVFAYVGGTTTISAVSICGTPMTLIDAGGPAGYDTVLAYGTVTGGSCTVAVTSSVALSVDWTSVALGTLSNLSSTTPGTSCNGVYPATPSPYPCTSGITVLASGFGIGGLAYNQTTTITSSNMTIDAQYNGTSDNQSVAIGHTTSSNTPSFGGAGFAQASVVAAPWR